MSTNLKRHRGCIGRAGYFWNREISAASLLLLHDLTFSIIFPLMTVGNNSGMTTRIIVSIDFGAV